MENKYGFCNLSIVPVRKNPEHISEMVSQLIFGETFKIIDNQDIWVKIETTHDNYIGWVHFLQFTNISESEYFEIINHEKIIIDNHISDILDNTNNFCLPLPFGSLVLAKPEKTFTIGNLTFSYTKQTNVLKSSQNRLIENALTFLGSPYLWGGRSHFGIDCSGFSQIIFRLEGIDLPRDAYQQSNEGETIAFIDQAKQGDLLFFGNDENSITHVGIYLGNRQIIHASGLVKIGTVDQFGIYCPYIKKYTHQLRTIKRLI